MERRSLRLRKTTWRCFGLVILALFVIIALLTPDRTLQLPGPGPELGPAALRCAIGWAPIFGAT